MSETTGSVSGGGRITRAAVIDGFGNPDVLHTNDIELTDLTEFQVQLEVAAVAVNPVDLTTRAGRNISADDARFPMVLGWDVAGTVVATGSEVTDWQVGDRAAAMLFQPIDQHGTYARHINLEAGLLARVPDGLDLTRAATVPLVGLTAAQLLDSVDLSRGETLLVDGPLGAVGRAVTALAVRAGIQIIGVARPEQFEQLRALGVAIAVPRDDDDTVRRSYPDGVDAGIDLVGGVTAHRTFGLVRDGGRYSTSVPVYIDPDGPFETARGITLKVLTVATDAGRLADLLDLAARGILPTPIEQTYALEHAGAAHERQAAGRLRGRVVLVP